MLVDPVSYLRNDNSVIVKEIVNTNCSYYLPQELNNIICAKSIDFNLSCFHHNCRSFSKYVSEIQCLLNTIDTKFYIVSFSETWFNEETARLHCNTLPGYSMFFQNRKGSEHSSVVAFIKSNFKVTVLNTIHTN